MLLIKHLSGHQAPSLVYLALSYDHRIVDGADAARFLSTLKERLEEGRFESDLGL
jgi:2-oxoglutarate dehydrogenase E2 component (dihydrolipoamide succinyltransferase)